MWERVGLKCSDVFNNLIANLFWKFFKVSGRVLGKADSKNHFFERLASFAR